jgi:hypothetical protein
MLLQTLRPIGPLMRADCFSDTHFACELTAIADVAERLWQKAPRSKLCVQTPL